MGHKGNAFNGFFGGGNYKRLAALFGMDERFYRQGIGSASLGPGMKALDLGCGPGALSYALAETAHQDSTVYGVDISEDQLAYARAHAGNFCCSLEFINASMDELPFPDGSIDIVISSMALHETPPAVRRAAIAETSRVLKDSGAFILIDWSRPKLGLLGIVWFPLICFGSANKDNWNNAYPEICLEHRLVLKSDVYLNSITRRQTFQKAK